MEFENNVYFWQKIDTMILSSDIITNRPKNSTHPKYPNLVYPVDYGYFSDSLGESAQEVSCYVGTESLKRAKALVICADILKKDIEVKVLIGCTDEEEASILRFLNQTDFQKTVIMRRGNNVPAWNDDDNYQD